MRSLVPHGPGRPSESRDDLPAILAHSREPKTRRGTRERMVESEKKPTRKNELARIAVLLEAEGRGGGGSLDWMRVDSEIQTLARTRAELD